MTKKYQLMRRAASALVATALVVGTSPISAIAAPPALPSGEAPQGGQGAPQSGGFGGGANTQTFDYAGTYSATVTADGESVEKTSGTYEASEKDVNVALAQNGGSLALSGVTLTKSGDDTSGDPCNFYGVNSIALAVGEGSTMTINNSQLNATSTGSNAVFATDQANVTIANSSISTTSDNSRGLDATYGGTINATNVVITTKGEHCAALATDRGGGTVTLDNSQVNGVVTTEGSGSPLLYSTGDIEVTGMTGTATGSQIAGMEGLNTISISDSSLTSTITGKTASDPVANGVIIYQSTSGDADTSTGAAANFTATDSSLASSIQNGTMFYLTNTNAVVTLKNTALNFDASNNALLTAAGNSSNNWGSAGSNGAGVSLVLDGETVEGTISADTISAVKAFLQNGTTWTGTGSIVENANGSTSETPLEINVDATSTWVVTADTTVSVLNVAEGGKLVDAAGNTVEVIDAAGNVLVEGTSDITVTTGSYSTTVDADQSAPSVSNSGSGSGSGQGVPDKPGEQGGQHGEGEEPPAKPEDEQSGEGEQPEQQATTGWEQTDAGWKYHKEDGTDATGWLYDADTWYYLENNGLMRTGWLCEDGTWYYLNRHSGAMLKGWQFVDGQWYFFRSSGAMAFGCWIWDGSHWYYLDGEGHIVRGTTVDGCHLDQNGIWVA